MAKILILYDDGTVSAKKEENITEEDIRSSSYLLVDTNTCHNGDHRNFVMVESSKYKYFTNAIIEYQLMMIYMEYDNEVNYSPIKPIHTETTKFSELICMLNTIERVNVTNNLFGNFTINDDSIYIGYNYVGVKLLDKDKVIYDKYFEIKGTSTKPYESENVIKKFKEIYPYRLMNDFLGNKSNVYLYEYGNSLTWEVSDVEKDKNEYSYIGIPMQDSNSIIFCTGNEYSNLKKYKSMEFYFYIYFEKETVISDISEMIVSGIEPGRIIETINNSDGVFLDAHEIAFSYGHRLNKVLDILAHLKFIFESTNLLFSEVYPYEIKTKGLDKYDFDSVLVMNLSERARGKGSNHMKEVCMNICSLLNVTDILNNI